MVSWEVITAVIFVTVNLSLFTFSAVETWRNRQTALVPVLNSVYDKGTNLGVAFLWLKLMSDHFERGNVEAFFVCSVAFMILPRFIVAAVLVPSGRNSALTAFLFLDFTFIYDIYHNDGFLVTKSFQLVETVCASVPQMLVQVIFLVLTQGAPQLKKSYIVLLWTSVLASVSCLTKCIVWTDVDAGLFKESGLVYGALFFGWRLCQVVTRLCIFCLLCVTFGPIFLPIYYVVSLCAFLVFFFPQNWEQWFTFLVAPIAIFHDPQYMAAICPPHAFRRVDNCCALLAIGAFMFLHFDCVICADSSVRSDSDSNPFVLRLLFAACICFVAEIILFVLLQPKVSDNYA